MAEERQDSLQNASTSQTRQKSSVEAGLAERLVEWFRANDGQLGPDVRAAYSDSRGFHIRAIRPLSSPVVVQCPLKLSLSYLNLDHTHSAVLHVDSPLQKCLGQVPSHVLTYLLLIEQRSLAKRGKGESRWEPYLDCLPEPEAMTTTLWFDDEDLKCLAGTNLAGATRDRLHELNEEYEQAVKVMTEFGVPIPDWSRFRWASNIMSSRSFISSPVLPDRDTFPILFPVVDLLNHSGNAKIEWNFQPFRDFTLKVVDQEGIRPGDEIYNNYGPKQNDELLLGYGFCIPDNPIEQFALKMVLPPAIEDAAKDFGLYDVEQVAFGMSKAFLDGDPKTEQHFLRPREHPFGQWDNKVPCLRGIPPWIVHIFFVTSLMELDIEPATVNKDRPPAEVVLEVLGRLYEAIRAKSQALPISHEPRTAFPNDKQKYATIYRDGQAKIIHGIRKELEAVIDKLEDQSDGGGDDDWVYEVLGVPEENL